MCTYPDATRMTRIMTHSRGWGVGAAEQLLQVQELIPSSAYYAQVQRRSFAEYDAHQRPPDRRFSGLWQRHYHTILTSWRLLYLFLRQGAAWGVYGADDLRQLRATVSACAFELCGSGCQSHIVLLRSSVRPDPQAVLMCGGAVYRDVFSCYGGRPSTAPGHAPGGRHGLPFLMSSPLDSRNQTARTEGRITGTAHRSANKGRKGTLT